MENNFIRMIDYNTHTMIDYNIFYLDPKSLNSNKTSEAEATSCCWRLTFYVEPCFISSLITPHLRSTWLEFSFKLDTRWSNCCFTEGNLDHHGWINDFHNASICRCGRTFCSHRHYYWAFSFSLVRPCLPLIPRFATILASSPSHVIRITTSLFFIIANSCLFS